MATTIIGIFDDFTAAVNTTPDMEILRRHRALRVDQRSSRLTNDDPTELSSEVTR
jgi:hypothetical protein